MRFSSLFHAGGAFVLSIGRAAALSPAFLDVALNPPPDADVGSAGQTTSTVPDGAAYRAEFLDPNYWHPLNPNFEIIDWERWEACEPVVPLRYDPPQRSQPSVDPDVPDLGEIFDASLFFQWGRQDQLSDEVIATGAKPTVGNVTDPDMGLFRGLLGPRPESSVVPEPFRNKLLWMQDNWIFEYLVSFNRGAWRTNTPEGRVIGLAQLSLDWTYSATELPFGIATTQMNSFLNFQMSPDGKWLQLYTSSQMTDPEGAPGKWLAMYIVQEGDVFTDKDGNVLEWVQPGDIYRLEYGDTRDPYKCKEVTYAYFPRVVATLDKATGVVTTVPRNHGDLIAAVTAEPPAPLAARTDNFTTSANLTQPDKFDFVSTYEPDRQMYLSSPEPPYGAIIEDIGASTAPTASPATAPTTGAPTASPAATPTTDAPAAASVLPSKSSKSKAGKSKKGKGKKANKRNAGARRGDERLL